MVSKCWMGWGGRRQRTILANPRKIQNSNKPHKLNFSWGEKIYDAIIYAAPWLLKSLYFCYLPDFQEDFESWHLKSQTKYPSASSMNLLAGIVALYVIDICQNCNPYFCSSVIDICQKCNSPESSATCGDAPYLQFYAFRITSQQMSIPKERK